ncbi:hypothetical protein BDB00DRAFT_847792 [Zychaea mexicana]|uniref:uncharacterized protein n=1 Tax=Zychaea mexicana TaxID=64656 RepID=UPI0022FEEEF5|nr:uncharacterized protein BDB00DRAFT_847792 [Zychaea mexicana]KAI9488472.1 hypothetical protein BDB00DRAFT_847792 [Zychaea mexicana]
MGSNESKLSNNKSTKKHPHTTATAATTTTTTAEGTGGRAAAAHEETSSNNGSRRGIRFLGRGHPKGIKKDQQQQAEQPQPGAQPVQNYNSPSCTPSSAYTSTPGGGAGRRPSLKMGWHSNNIITMIKHPQASMRRSFSSGSASTDSSDTSKTATSAHNLDNCSATNYLADGTSSAMISAVATAMTVGTPSMDSRTSSFPNNTTTGRDNGNTQQQQQQQQIEQHTPLSRSTNTQFASNNNNNNNKVSNEQIQIAQNAGALLHPAKSQKINCVRENTEHEAQIDRTGERLLKELYLLPESDSRRRKERDRQQRQHYLLKYVWRANFKVPLQSPTLIVNWCCGTGIWAMEMAQQFPTCQVIGMDFQSATLSSLGRSINNLSFQNIVVQHDTTGLESLQEGSVDYLMMRDVWLVNSPAHKWVETLKQVFRVLKPGGWVEIYEQDLIVNSPGPLLKIVDDWFTNLFKDVGIQRKFGDQIASMMHQTGYVEIDERAIELPVGEWSSVPGKQPYRVTRVLHGRIKYPHKITFYIYAALKETGYLFMDLMMRRYRTFAPWVCEFNDISLNEVNDVLDKWPTECEEYKTSMCWRYFAAQKPAIIEKAGLST